MNVKKTYEIKNMRMNLGKFLHNYYTKFGEEKYEEFLEKLSSKMESEYGEPFSRDNLRIMEAEFITFNSFINDKKQVRDNIKQ